MIYAKKEKNLKLRQSNNKGANIQCLVKYFELVLIPTVGSQSLNFIRMNDKKQVQTFLNMTSA